MNSKTSVKAYWEAVEEGTISQRERDVLSYLAKGDATGREISKVVPGGWKRLALLEQKGMVARVGTAKDPETGKIGYKWTLAYNKQLPLYPAPKRPSRAILERNMAQLEAENRQLREKVADYERALPQAYKDGYANGAASVGNVVLDTLGANHD